MDINCKGFNCPIKDKCLRYTSKETEQQSHLQASYIINEETNSFSCNLFWGEQQESIMFQLESIVKGKK